MFLFGLSWVSLAFLAGAVVCVAVGFIQTKTGVVPAWLSPGHLVPVAVTLVVGVAGIELTKFDITKLTRGELVEQLTRVVRERDLAGIAVDLVLHEDVFFVRSTYAGELSFLEGPQWKPDQRNRLVLVNAKVVKEIKNPLDVGLKFPIAITHLNIVPLGDAQGPGDCVYRKMTIVMMDENHRVVSTKVLDSDELNSSISRDGRTKLKPEIPPNHFEEVTLETRTFERISDGGITFLTQMPTLDMDMSLRFPNGRFGNLEPANPLFAHGGCREADMSTTTKWAWHIDADSGMVRARIRNGILPLNGIVLRWRRAEGNEPPSVASRSGGNDTF